MTMKMHWICFLSFNMQEGFTMNEEKISPVIRLAKSKENIAQKLVEISEGSYQYGSPWNKEQFEKVLEQDHVFVLVVETNKEILGFLCGGLNPFEAEIYNIAISQKHKRLGLASDLIHKMKRMIVANRIGEIFLEVRESNIGAIKLYKTMGFEPVGLRKDYYTKPSEDALILKCKIDSMLGGR